jgi:hypothetical protein
MGSSSKVLLVGATSLIVGVYAISLKNVQTTGMQTAQSQVDRINNERMVDAALSLALDDTKSSFENNTLKKNGDTKVVSNKSALGGTIGYTLIRKSTSTAEIDITVSSSSGKNRIVIAQVEQTRKNHGYRKVHRSDWRVASVFVKKG